MLTFPAIVVEIERHLRQRKVEGVEAEGEADELARERTPELTTGPARKMKLDLGVKREEEEILGVARKQLCSRVGAVIVEGARTEKGRRR